MRKLVVVENNLMVYLGVVGKSEGTVTRAMLGEKGWQEAIALNKEIEAKIDAFYATHKLDAHLKAKAKAK